MGITPHSDEDAAYIEQEFKTAKANTYRDRAVWKLEKTPREPGFVRPGLQHTNGHVKFMHVWPLAFGGRKRSAVTASARCHERRLRTRLLSETRASTSRALARLCLRAANTKGLPVGLELIVEEGLAFRGQTAFEFSSLHVVRALEALAGLRPSRSQRDS
jgi:hypothetical protein